MSRISSHKEAADMLRKAGWTLAAPKRVVNTEDRLPALDKWVEMHDGDSRLFWGAEEVREGDEDTEEIDDPPTPVTAVIVRRNGECDHCTCHTWLVFGPSWDDRLWSRGVSTSREAAKADSYAELLRQLGVRP